MRRADERDVARALACGAYRAAVLRAATAPEASPSASTGA
jgi:hypothetical protein